jgi:protein-S-isoprenylcysteine O-methyltransferase Ste14
MTVTVKKAVFALVVSVVALGVAVPVAFWFACNALDAALGLQPVIPRPVSLILAAAAVLIGVFWATWAYSYLVFVGKGVPLEAFGRALHPTRFLVTAGPYAYVRNPMMLGLFFGLLGVACLARSLSGLILVPIIAALFLIYAKRFEEPHLVRRFGADYEEYRGNVPSLIPRLSPYVHETAANA